MGWIPDFGYQKNRDSDKEAFKFMKKKKKATGQLGKRLDMEFKPLTKANKGFKGLV